MTLPNFLIIGAPKAGTTSLWHYLGQHPDIFMSKVKEPDFFREAKEDRVGVVASLAAYEALFEDAAGCTAIGEASPTYLSDPDSVPAIRKLLPEVLLIAILRDPCRRSFSEYTYQRMRGQEPAASFLEAFNTTPLAPGAGGIDYLRDSLYFRNLSRYFAAFPAQQIKVVFNEELKRDAPRVLSGLFAFLGVDPSVRVNTAAELTVSGVPRNRALHRLLAHHNPIKDILVPVLPRWARDMGRRIKVANLQRQSMTAAEHAAVLPYFDEDIRQLERLLAVDLSAWRELDRPPPPADPGTRAPTLSSP